MSSLDTGGVRSQPGLCESLLKKAAAAATTKKTELVGNHAARMRKCESVEGGPSVQPSSSRRPGSFQREVALLCDKLHQLSP